MFAYFRFSLPRAVTEQLVERLGHLKTSPLTAAALKKLKSFQAKSGTTPGVYVIYLDQCAVYAGKAEDVAERLAQHLWKLSGRRGIDPEQIKVKALLLDENWSTSTYFC